MSTTEDAIREFLRQEQEQERAAPAAPPTPTTLEDAITGFLAQEPAPPANAFVRTALAPEPGLVGPDDPGLRHRARELGKGVLRLGGGLISGAGSLVRMAPQAATETLLSVATPAAPALSSPLIRAAAERQLTKLRRPAEAATTERIGGALEEAGKRVEERFKGSGVGYRAGGGFQPGDIDYLIENASGPVAQLAVQFGSAYLTRGRSALAQLTAFAAPTVTLEGGGAFREAEEKLLARGVDPETAQQQATTVGLITGLGSYALEAVPFGVYFANRIPGVKKIVQDRILARLSTPFAKVAAATGTAGRLAGRGIAGSLGEGWEEFTQELWGDLVAYGSQTDPEAFADWQKRYTEAAGLGAIIGGPAAVATTKTKKQEEAAKEFRRVTAIRDAIAEIKQRTDAGEQLEPVVAEVRRRLLDAGYDLDRVPVGPPAAPPAEVKPPPAAPAAPTIATEAVVPPPQAPEPAPLPEAVPEALPEVAAPAPPVVPEVEAELAYPNPSRSLDREGKSWQQVARDVPADQAALYQNEVIAAVETGTLPREEGARVEQILLGRGDPNVRPLLTATPATVEEALELVPEAIATEPSQLPPVPVPVAELAPVAPAAPVEPTVAAQVMLDTSATQLLKQKKPDLQASYQQLTGSAADPKWTKDKLVAEMRIAASGVIARAKAAQQKATPAPAKPKRRAKGEPAAAAPPAAPAAAPRAAPKAPAGVPSREEAVSLSEQSYPQVGVAGIERRALFMEGYDDAVAGKPRRTTLIGPYRNAYDMVARARRLAEEGTRAEEGARLFVSEPAVEPERIAVAAYRGPDGKIYIGKTHEVAKQAARADGVVTVASSENDGYITTRNRFVSREEAGVVGRAAGQTAGGDDATDYLWDRTIGRYANSVQLRGSMPAVRTGDGQVFVAPRDNPTHAGALEKAYAAGAVPYRPGFAPEGYEDDSIDGYVTADDQFLDRKLFNRLWRAQQGARQQRAAPSQQLMVSVPEPVPVTAPEPISAMGLGTMRPGEGRFGFAPDLVQLTLEELTAVMERIRAALTTEQGTDKLADMVNVLLGTSVRVQYEGGLSPLANPNTLASFTGLPLDPEAARVWLRSYMAVRGILFGRTSESFSRIVGDEHNKGEYNGYVVEMTAEEFAMLGALDGATYDAVSRIATFVNFQEVPQDTHEREIVSRLERIPDRLFAISRASFEGEQHGQGDFFTTLGRDPATLRRMAGILADDIAPALAGTAAGAPRNLGRIRDVVTGLNSLAYEYEFPPPRGTPKAEATAKTLAIASLKLVDMLFGSKPMGGAPVAPTEDAGEEKQRQYRRERNRRADKLTNRLIALTNRYKQRLQDELHLTEEQTVNWYAGAAGRQRDIMTLIQPELANDPDFVLSTAIHSILSNGNQVNIETWTGAHVFEQFLFTGEITYLDPMSADRGTFVGGRQMQPPKPGKKPSAAWAAGQRFTKPGLWRYVRGLPGRGIGGREISRSSKWLTHEIGLRRLDALVKTLGKEEAARWLKESRTMQNGKIKHHAIELLGPKIGQYFLDKMAVPNQASTIDLWIGRLYDILTGEKIISESVTPEKRSYMQEVFRRYAEAGMVDSPAAAQALAWYITKFAYRDAGAEEKATAYATLGSAAADFLAGSRELAAIKVKAERKKQGAPPPTTLELATKRGRLLEAVRRGARARTAEEVSVGLPKAGDIIVREPVPGWFGDSKFDVIAAREGWPGLVDDYSLLGFTEADYAEMGTETAEALRALETELVRGETLLAYQLATDLPEILTRELVETLGDEPALRLSINGLPTRAERVAAMEWGKDVVGAQLGLVGQLVTGARQLAGLMRPFRDPRFEHAHIVLMDDDGRVVYHGIDTCGLVAQVRFRSDRFYQLHAIAKAKGATRVAFVHNHPSGDTTPSLADETTAVSFAAALANVGLTVEYDMVINHDEAHTIRVENARYPYHRVRTEKLKLYPEQAYDWTQQPTRAVASTADIARMAGKVAEPGTAYVIYLNTQNRIIAAEPHRVEALSRASTLGWLDKSMSDLGASNIVVVTDNAGSPGSHPGISFALSTFGMAYNRLVVDVIDVGEGGRVYASARVRGELAEPRQERVPIMASATMIAAGGGDVMAEAQAGPVDVPTRAEERPKLTVTPPYDATEGLPGDPPDPRVAELASDDIITRVVAALKIGTAKEQISREQIQRAVIAGLRTPQLPGRQAMAPRGRGTYVTERWLLDVLPTALPAEAHGEEVVSPEVIIAGLTAAVRMPLLTTGKRWQILRLGAAGAYKPGLRVGRLVQRGDIETAAHEIGHHVHELIHGLRGAGKRRKLDISAIPATQQAELLKLARGMKPPSVAEGIAEFWRRYVTNLEAVILEAPEYYRFATAELEARQPKVKQALDDARYAFRQWLTATDAARIRSRIHSLAEDAPPNPNKSWFDDKIERYVNDLHYIRVIEDRLLGKDAPPEVRASCTAQLTRGSGGLAHTWLKIGQLDWKTQQVIGRPLEAILQPIFRARAGDNFRTYAVARRGLERILKGYDVGFDEQTARNVIAELETDFFKATFDELAEYNHNLLKMMVDAGVLAEMDYVGIAADIGDGSPEQDGIANYIPFHRVSEKRQSERRKERRMYVSQRVVKHFRGDTADIIDPLESMFKNTYMFTHACMLQQVGHRLSELFGKDGAGSYADIVKPAPVKQEVPFEPIWEQIDEESGGALGKMPKAVRGMMARIWRPGDFFNTPNVISILQTNEKTGEQERIWVEVIDPDLYRALTGIGRDSLKKWVRILSIPSMLRRSGAILSPEFMIRNVGRDQISAFTNSEYGFRFGIDLVRGMFELFKQGDYFRHWQASGGEYATINGLDRASLRRHVEDLEKGKIRVANVIKTPIAMLQALSATMENGTRMGEFMRALDTEIARGTPHEAARFRAALASRRVTTDFAQHGYALDALRAMATFWNAGLQGDIRTSGAFQHHPRRAIWISLLTITLPSLLSVAVHWDDEEYWEIPQWQRDLFWMFKVPGNWWPDALTQTEESGRFGQWLKPFVARGDGIWIRIPKPFGQGQVFGSIPERLLQWARNDDPEGFKETMENLAPWGSTPLFGGYPDFPIVQPFFDNARNWSRFLQRPIVPRAEEELPDVEQYGPRTSEFAKAASKFFAHVPGADYAPFGLTSPYKFENLFRSWTAGLGGYATGAVDLIAKPIARGRNPDIPVESLPAAKQVADLPLVRALAARAPTWGSESIQRFYERYTELRKHQQVYEYRKKKKDLAAAYAYQDAHQEELSEFRYVLEPAARRIAAIRERALLDDRQGTMSPAEKQQILEAAGREATEMAAEAIGRPYRAKDVKRHSLSGEIERALSGR